jgi:hypothetical protein
MNKVNYGGIYKSNNQMDIGRIHIRFFRNGTMVCLITSNIETNDKIFNLLQKHYNNKDVLEYRINNDVIKFMINTRIGVLQLTGKINNDNIILNITNIETKTNIANNIIFNYYKKLYSNKNDNNLNAKSQIVKSKLFKKKTSEVKTKENIPGGPKMARSFNGFSYRCITKWKP